MATTTNHQDDLFAAWSRQLFESLTDGGVWGIPRSGLLFRREGDDLVLVEMMPYDPALPMTPAELDEQQESEYEGVREQFARAGIEVRRADS